MKNHVILLFKPIVIASAAVIARVRSVRSNPDTRVTKRLWLWIASSLAFLAMTAGVRAGIKAGVIAMTVGVAAVAVMGALPAYAQQVLPDDACSAGESGRYLHSGGPSLGGDGYLLVCNGTRWIKVFGFEADGVFRPQFSNMASCEDGAILTYEAASGGLRCALACSNYEPNSFNVIDIADAPLATVTESNIVRIHGINCIVSVTVSGEGAPQYRICSNATCSAGNVIQDWTASGTPISNNQYVQMRMTSPLAGGDAHTAYLAVGSSVEIWNVYAAGDCDDPSPPPGTICADGTVFAGFSPDGDQRMYTTRCDEGVVWNGVSCAGSPVTLPWNDYNMEGYVYVGVNNGITGRANTATLAATDSDSISEGFQPHRAAMRCADLMAHGHDDWYLPAANEWADLHNNREVIKNLSGRYATSTEASVESRWIFLLDGGFASTGTGYAPRKHEQHKIRCVRRDG